MPNTNKEIADILFGRPKLYDNDVLTYFWIIKKTPFCIQLPDTIASVCLLPASDGNGIYPNNEYELFYFDKASYWISCGKQKATSYSLTYKQVPQGALFWLRNLTTGRQERIFTYEEEKLCFW